MIRPLLRMYISSLLVEGRLDDVKKKYPEHAELVSQLANADPSGNLKYLQWMTKQVVQGQIAKDVIALVDKFHQLLPRLAKKDINSYRTLDDLKEVLNGLEGQESRGTLRRAAHDDTDYVYDDGRYLIARPHTMEASCHYGHGTQWCVSATTSQNYFNSYSSRGVHFFFIIDRQAKQESKFSKVAIAEHPHESGREVYDANDNHLDEDILPRIYGEAKWQEFNRAITAAVGQKPTTRVEEFKKITDQKKIAQFAKTMDIGGAELLAENPNIGPEIVKLILEKLVENAKKSNEEAESFDYDITMANLASNRKLTPAMTDMLVVAMFSNNKPVVSTQLIYAVTREVPTTPALVRTLISSRILRAGEPALLLSNETLTEDLEYEFIKDYMTSRYRPETAGLPSVIDKVRHPKALSYLMSLDEDQNDPNSRFGRLADHVMWSARYAKLSSIMLAMNKSVNSSIPLARQLLQDSSGLTRSILGWIMVHRIMSRESLAQAALRGRKSTLERYTDSSQDTSRVEADIDKLQHELSDLANHRKKIESMFDPMLDSPQDPFAKARYYINVVQRDFNEILF